MIRKLDDVASEDGLSAPAAPAAPFASPEPLRSLGTEGGAIARLSDDLSRMNERLAEVLRMPAAPLAHGGVFALHDDLIVCGVLGGKDVGKSTLINALAGERISESDEEVGAGTTRPLAYVHEDVRQEVDARLRQLERDFDLDVRIHRAEAIRQLVLVDLPDFDSEFRLHHQQVKRLAPLFDRVLWVMTPRKVGDREWVSMFTRTIKDPSNVHCVLNKVDELFSDDEPFSAGAEDSALDFWRKQKDWFRESLTPTGCFKDADHHFVIAARYPTPAALEERVAWLWNDPQWQAYAADRETVARIARLASEEFDRLRDCIMGPLSLEKARAIKKANQRREMGHNVALMRRHYELDRLFELLDLCEDSEYRQSLLDEGFGEVYTASVARSLQTRMRSNAELADELLERRVEDWKLLWWIYWFFGWLPRLLGRRYSTVMDARLQRERDVFSVGGMSLQDRARLIRARFLSDQALLLKRLSISESVLPSDKDLARQAKDEADQAAGDFESRLLETLRKTDRLPGRPQRYALWAVLLWFPFLQPILQGMLDVGQGGAGGSVFLVSRGLYAIVTALGPTKLLIGFSFVAAVYVIILTVMYARALKAVRDLREKSRQASPMVDLVEALLMEHTVLPLLDPLARHRAKLAELRSAFEALAREAGA